MEPAEVIRTADQPHPRGQDGLGVGDGAPPTHQGRQRRANGGVQPLEVGGIAPGPLPLAASLAAMAFAVPRTTAPLDAHPTPPAGQEGNWITTADGKPFFVMFRIYGPQKPIADKSWGLNDIEHVR